MHGLVFGFPKCVAFVDGTKQKTVRPLDDDTQEERYDGHHKMHCFSVLLWTDVYGVIIRPKMRKAMLLVFLTSLGQQKVGHIACNAFEVAGKQKNIFFRMSTLETFVDPKTLSKPAGLEAMQPVMSETTRARSLCRCAAAQPRNRSAPTRQFEQSTVARGECT